MAFQHFFEWLSQTSLSITLRNGTYYFPILVIIHVLTIGLFGGMVAMANLRVLGLVLQDIPVSRVFSQFRPWKWIGFGILLITGTMLSLSDPVEYGGNIMFWISLVILLVAALNAFVFHYGVYRTVAEWDEAPRAPARARAWALRSLVLWISLVFIGRAIAFF